MKKNKGRKRYNKVKAKRVKAYTGFTPNIKIDLEGLKGKKPIKQKDGFDAVDFEKEDTTTSGKEFACTSDACEIVDVGNL